MKKPYLLKKRQPQNIYYYQLAHEKTFHSTGQTTKARAEQFVLSLINGESVDAKEKTLMEFTTHLFEWDKCAYVRRQQKKGRNFTKFTAQMRRGHLVNYLWKAFGSRKLRSLSANEVDDWLIGLPLANKTKNHILGTTKIVLEEAVRSGIISQNPIKAIDRFPDDSAGRDIFTEEELRKLFPMDHNSLLDIWTDLMWGTFFYVIATTGVRLGEAKALTWGDWHKQKRFLHVHHAVKNDETIGNTKNGEDRVVPVINRAGDLLSLLYDQADFTDESDLIFCMKRGKPLDRKTCSRYFNKGIENSEIENGHRNLTTHCLRHTANTNYRKFMDDDVLRLVTGHKNEAMTDHYDHPTMDDNVTSILPFLDRIDQFWSTVKPSNEKEVAK